MNTKPEVINYRRTPSRKVVTVTGVANAAEAEIVALDYTGETRGRLYNIYTDYLPTTTFVVNLCTD